MQYRDFARLSSTIYGGLGRDLQVVVSTGWFGLNAVFRVWLYDAGLGIWEFGVEEFCRKCCRSLVNHLLSVLLQYRNLRLDLPKLCTYHHYDLRSCGCYTTFTPNIKVRSFVYRVQLTMDRMAQ